LFATAYAVVTPICPDASHNIFNVSLSGLNTFSIFGLANPKITIKQGCAYVFNLDASVTTAFHVRPTPGGSDFAVTGNGQTGPFMFHLTIANVSDIVYTSGANNLVYGDLDVVANTITCAQYCSDFRLACSQSPDTSTYASQQECEAVCLSFPSNPNWSFTDFDFADIFECRSQQAMAEANSQTVRVGFSVCANAGLTGGVDYVGNPGECGQSTAFAPYCRLVDYNCTNNNKLYTTQSDCVSFFGADGAGIWSTANSFTGNTFFCRMVHAQNAALGGANVACPAASMLGGNVCGSYCSNYCNYRQSTLASSQCTVGVSSCASDCVSIATTGSLIGFGTGSTLQCYEANVAFAVANGDINFCNLNRTCPVASSSGARSSSSYAPSSSAATGGTGGTGNTGNTGPGETSPGSHITLQVFAALVVLSNIVMYFN